MDKIKSAKLLSTFFCCVVSVLMSYTHSSLAAPPPDSDILDFIPAIVSATNSPGGPCNKDINRLTRNCILRVNSNYDLAGRTIDVPRGVSFEFFGGSIINGTLVFNSGSIDGRILNSRLNIVGNAKLIDPLFYFYPEKWDIVQVGNSSNPVAPSQKVGLANHRRIQQALNLSKRLGATTFKTDRLDAYFFTEKRSIPIIELPSQMHFRMSSNTRLRVLPSSGDFSPLVFRIQGQSNVRVSGGFIIGDRLEHGPIDGGNVTFEIKGGQNVIVENMNISLSSSTGLTINSVLFEGDPRYFASKNVLVRNCTFDSNRNNNLSITDGENITVENSRFYKAGVDLPGKFGVSKGRAPRIGIVIEPVQGQVVNGVSIKNNTVTGTRTNSILAALGNDFIITGNTVDGGIGWTSSSVVRVTNNTILGGIIVGGSTGGYALSQSRDNVVSGNTVRNCATGMRLTNDDIQVFNNRIINCKVGIMLTSLQDSNIYDNEIVSNLPGSFGINGQVFVDNVVVRNNDFDIAGRAMSIISVNDDPGQEGYLLVFRNNGIKASDTGRVTFSSGIQFTENNFTGAGFGLGDVKNILFNKNTVVNSFGPSFSINKSTLTTDLQIIDNVFDNINPDRLSGYGVKINTVGDGASTGDTNVVISNNDISVLGKNYGLHSTDFNGMTIENNTIVTQEYVSIYFRGNNSLINNNQTVNGVDIEGTGNTGSNI